MGPNTRDGSQHQRRVPAPETGPNTIDGSQHHRRVPTPETGPNTRDGSLCPSQQEAGGRRSERGQPGARAVSVPFRAVESGMATKQFFSCLPSWETRWKHWTNTRASKAQVRRGHGGRTRRAKWSLLQAGDGSCERPQVRAWT